MKYFIGESIVSNISFELASILKNGSSNFQSLTVYAITRTKYTRTSNWHTGKCIYWKYVVKTELSKLTYVEDQIIISQLFLCISLIFLQKAKVQYTTFKTVLLYLLKVIRLYEHQQETKVPFLAIFYTFSKKSGEIKLKRW